MVLCAHAQQSSEATRQALAKLGAEFYDQCHVELLPTADEKFKALFNDIAAAREYIHLDYFKFQNDSICHCLFDLLAHKVEQGVHVRIVFDAVGNQYSDLPLDKDYLKAIRARGIEIYAFDPMSFP